MQLIMLCIMDRKLEDLSLEELWELFPIRLTEHQEYWAAWFADEKLILAELLPQDLITRIDHIGSTAIPGIWAKPIIDILIEVVDCEAMRKACRLLSKNGYICMHEDASRVSFNKGYTVHGFAERVFHIHLRLPGDNDEVYFREYLKRTPNVAEEYERLKLRLWREYEYDRDSYTEAKKDFVTRYTRIAKDMLCTPGDYR